MQRCRWSILWIRVSLLCFILFTVMPPMLQATEYFSRVSLAGREIESTGSVYILTNRRLNEGWLQEHAGINVRQVSPGTMRTNNFPYFTFNGGAGLMDLDYTEYSCHLIDIIRAILLVGADGHFRPRTISAASEPLREGQLDLFIEVNQLDQLGERLSSAGAWVGALRRQRVITGWQFMGLVFRDEGRVYIRIRVTTESQATVFNSFRSNYPRQLIRYLRVGGVAEYIPASVSDPVYNAFDISEVSTCYADIVRTELGSRGLLSIRPGQGVNPGDYQAGSYIVRFNIGSAADLYSYQWAGRISNFLSSANENHPHIAWDFVRIDGRRLSVNAPPLVLTFRMTVYGNFDDPESVLLSTFAGREYASDIRPWDTINVIWVQGERPPGCMAGISRRALRLFNRRNRTENADPAETDRLLTNPNRNTVRRGVILLPGNCQTN
ncbi:hypothetical protein [Endozoicomonas euniceicola]|uniref:Uncharacterized protein n=1 Tax=Endozoicomonas euniceicola TaxID=1234143 RepID=A0ABY6GYP5_9GAMM|nr:hypothetical protein [Endozoicomonas euniceicola]UYM17903.1 hypothetical protein NX720_08350 [Endozoicomonas euniceicola]